MDIYNSEISILKSETKNWNKASYIIIILIMFLITLCHILKYKTFLFNSGEVILVNNDYNIKTYINITELNNITNRDIVYINEKEYKYKILNISPEVFENNYKEVILKIDIEESKKINNNIIDLKFIKEEKEIIKYIKNYI